MLHPFGWDAFGLPAENAAIKSGIHPETSTLDNIAHMKGQLQRLGISYAWERELATCLPDYYHWNQWLFIRMFERGLAYRRRSTVNWCPVDNTVLANEQVVDGACWRCGTMVVEKDLEQWFFRITAYADDLLHGADGLTSWPEKVLTMQRNWIGRSEGARVRFAVEGEPDGIEVFTTRIDTIFGATVVLLAPEHPLVARLATGPEGERVRAEAQRYRGQERTARVSGEVEKEGIFTGRYAINPFTNEPVPIWIANFVLGEYGTGAVMAVPAHDERDFAFATKYGLPIRPVIASLPEGIEAQVQAFEQRAKAQMASELQTGSGGIGFFAETFSADRRCRNRAGVLHDSGEFSGLTSEAAQKAMIAVARQRGIGEGTVQYRLKDWGISRQRYWGTPIPMIHCPVDGVVAVPDAQLPVELPKVAEFTGRGDSPLAHVPEFVNVACPKCGGPARRETDTMDTFVDSSWYFYRFADAHNDRHAVRPGQGGVLVPGRLLLGRRRARHPAPDLLALLRPGVPRPGDDRPQRALHPPAHPGHGAEGRPRDVEVEGQRRRPRHDGAEGRRRCAAALRDVRGAAREGSRVDRFRARRQLPLAGPGLARGPAVAASRRPGRRPDRRGDPDRRPSGRCAARPTTRSAG